MIPLRLRAKYNVIWVTKMITRRNTRKKNDFLHDALAIKPKRIVERSKNEVVSSKKEAKTSFLPLT